jgi:hypothetical protein
VTIYEKGLARVIRSGILSGMNAGTLIGKSPEAVLQYHVQAVYDRLTFGGAKQHSRNAVLLASFEQLGLSATGVEIEELTERVCALLRAALGECP